MCKQCARAIIKLYFRCVNKGMAKNKSTGDFIGLRKDNDNVGGQRGEGEEWHIHAAHISIVLVCAS